MRNNSRLFYYVEGAPSGWLLATQEEPGWVSPIDYASRDEAVAAAIHLARQEWQSSGRPTGVRFRDRPGAAWSERIFGNDSAELSSAAE